MSFLLTGIENRFPVFIDPNPPDPKEYLSAFAQSKESNEEIVDQMKAFNKLSTLVPALPQEKINSTKEGINFAIKDLHTAMSAYNTGSTNSIIQYLQRTGYELFTVMNTLGNNNTNSITMPDNK